MGKFEKTVPGSQARGQILTTLNYVLLHELKEHGMPPCMHTYIDGQWVATLDKGYHVLLITIMNVQPKLGNGL
jgi:hypothetical protein